MSQIAGLIQQVQMWKAKCAMLEKIVEKQRQQIKELQAGTTTIIEAEIIDS